MSTRPNFGDILEPGFRKIFNDRYSEIPQKFTQLFRINTSEKYQEKDSAVSGFGKLTPTGENDPITYEDPVQMYDVTYTHLKYTKGFRISEELYEDDLYNVMNKKPAALGRAARRTEEYYAAQVFNNAFSTSYLGGDAKPLCSVSHPRADGGTAQSNASSTGLVFGEENLFTGIRALEDQVDDKGEKIMAEANTLVIGRQLRKQATEVLKSMSRSETGDNDTNFYKDEDINIMSWHYIDSSTGWWLIDKSLHELNWFWRVKAQFKQDNSFDTGAALYKTRERFSRGWSDYRGIWGSKGDGSAYAS
jgi:phage major head subunit gpT-like protein